MFLPGLIGKKKKITNAIDNLLQRKQINLKPVPGRKKHCVKRKEKETYEQKMLLKNKKELK